MMRNYLAPSLRAILGLLDFQDIEEVRVRLNRPLMVKQGGLFYVFRLKDNLAPQGTVTL